MHTVIVREMRNEDLDTVVEIDRLSSSLPWSKRTYELELTENQAAHLLIAEWREDPGAVVIGFIGYWHIVDEIHISTLAVHPRYRRNSVAQDLLNAAIRRAQDMGAEWVTLEVRVSNLPAVELYRKNDFEITRRKPGYYLDNNEDAFEMIRKIAIEESVPSYGG